MSNRIPVKTLFFIGLLLGAGIVTAAVTFNAGDAGTVSDNVTIGAPGGMNATIAGETDMILESDVLYPDSQTVQFKTESGNLTMQSSGPAWARVHKDEITGTWTIVDAIDAQNDITINPEDKRSITVGGDIERIEFRNAGIDNGQTDFVYAGASGTSTVTISGLQANTQIAAVDTTHGGILEVTTTDGSGVATFDSLDNSEHAVSLETSDGGPSVSNPQDDGSTRYAETTLSIDVADADFPDDTVTLEWYVDGSKVETTTANSAGTYSTTVGPFADGSYDWYVVATDEFGQTDASSTETFTIDHHDPQVSDVEPSGDLDTEPSQITAQINDTDFAKDGDSLTVTITLDGTQIDSQTIGSNQTVTTSMPTDGQSGGAHDIEIGATDNYGQSTTGTSSYRVPDTFTIRNETNHTQLVPADGEVRFFGNNQVYSRNAPDGTVNMTGLPVNQPFLVEIQPTDENYTTRTVYLGSIYEQQSAYVLNTSAYDTISSRFVLEDPTGEYDSETLLKIQKPIDINGSTEYQTIVADEFGVEGVTATLQEGQRYQLLVSRGTSSQSVGPYRADASETVAVEPGTPTIELSQVPAGFAYGSTLENTTLTYVYSDEQELTDKLTIWIHERGNTSNQLQPNVTAYDLGEYSGMATLTANESKQEWTVNFVVVRDGETFVVNNQESNTEDLTPPVGSNWTMIVGISALILFAGAFSVLNAGIGAIITTLVGGVLWYTGFLDGAATAATVTVALFVSVVGYIYTGGR
jgi:hypothetical protein